MARLNELIFGYRKGKVEEKDTAKLANVFLKLGACSDIFSDGSFSLGERDKKEFESYAKSKVRFILGETLGIYGFIKRQKRKYGLFLGILIMTVIFVLTSNLVWDIRISGNERLSDSYIEDALSGSGFEIGSSWSRIDKNAVETDILSKHPDVSWISLNRRGTVAYVELMESENINEDNAAPMGYCNVVADRDGVIEEITVEQGEALVKVGDVVKRGDVLISGIIENEGGVSFCHARGEVRAQNVEIVEAGSEREITKKVLKGRKLVDLKINVFKFSINIFKNYRNHGDDCDIIKEIRTFALFDKCRLPIKVEKIYSCEYKEVTVSFSDSEMISEAKRELDSKIYSMFKDSDVIKLRTNGEFSDGVYFLRSRVVYVTDIGKESAILIS